MKKTEISPSLPGLDEDIYRNIDEAIRPVELSAVKKETMRKQILDRIDCNQEPQDKLFLTVRQDDGDWIKISPKIEKKQLYIDIEKGIETYLLRFEAGGETPVHTHQQDEFCMVLEGSVDFADIHLTAGDFHMARKGSVHRQAISHTGALLYLQSSLSEHVEL
jgi:quercetin dioxygenase-like cupin family protein